MHQQLLPSSRTNEGERNWPSDTGHAFHMFYTNTHQCNYRKWIIHGYWRLGFTVEAFNLAFQPNPICKGCIDLCVVTLYRDSLPLPLVQTNSLSGPSLSVLLPSSPSTHVVCMQACRNKPIFYTHATLYCVHAIVHMAATAWGPLSPLHSPGQRPSSWASHWHEKCDSKLLQSRPPYIVPV